MGVKNFIILNRRVKLRELEVGRNRFCENTVEKCHFLSPLLEEVKLHVSFKFSSSNLDQEGVDSKNTNVGCELLNRTVLVYL